MKNLSIILLLILLSSCSGDYNEDGLRIVKFDTVCNDGIVYYYNYSGQHGGSYMSPKYNNKGELERCSTTVKIEDK